MRRRFGSVLVLAGALVVPSAGQESRRAADGAGDRGAAGRAAAAAAQQQQRDALQTLLFLRNSAAEVRDLKERVRVLLEVADALWLGDKGQAVEVFKQAMEQAAEFEDAADEKRRQSSAGRALRQQVITRIAQRDPALAHQLLRAHAPAPGEPTADSAFGQLYGRDTPRSDVLLSAASELLSTDAGVATQMARFATADGFSQGLRNFLVSLRAKDPASADALYEAVFRTASSRRPKQLSEALFIWDYAFQHGTIYLGPVAWLGERAAPLPVPPEHKRRALAFAVEAIVENVQQFDITAATEAERPLVRERYALIHSLASQVLPDVEALMPAASPLVQTHLNRLEQQLRELGHKPPSPPPTLPTETGVKDNVERLLELASRVSNPQTRDGVYAKAALTLYLHGQYERALDVAGKIENPSLARQLSGPIRFDHAGELISRGRLDEAAKVARAVEAPAPRALLLAGLGAAYFRAKLPAQAAAVLGEAEDIAAKASPSADAASAVLGIALAYAESDRPKAMGVTSEAVRMINAFEGEEHWEVLKSGVGSGGRLEVLNRRWSSGRGGVVTSLTVTYPRLAGLLEVLSKVAGNDLNEGLMLARQLKTKSFSYTVQAVLCRQAIERAQQPRRGAAPAGPRSS